MYKSINKQNMQISREITVTRSDSQYTLNAKNIDVC